VETVGKSLWLFDFSSVSTARQFPQAFFVSFFFASFFFLCVFHREFSRQDRPGTTIGHSLDPWHPLVLALIQRVSLLPK
jgi:hypothetical protein